MQKLTRIPRLFGIGKKPIRFQIAFYQKHMLLYPVYAGDRNCDDEVLITNIIKKTESISDDESTTLPSASPAKDSHRV